MWDPLRLEIVVSPATEGHADLFRKISPFGGVYEERGSQQGKRVFSARLDNGETAWLWFGTHMGARGWLLGDDSLVVAFHSSALPVPPRHDWLAEPGGRRLTWFQVLDPANDHEGVKEEPADEGHNTETTSWSKKRWICPQCKSEQEGGVQFCEQCGWAQGSNDWLCPGCGESQFGRNKVCRSCGTPKPVGRASHKQPSQPPPQQTWDTHHPSGQGRRPKRARTETQDPIPDSVWMHAS